MGKERDNLYYNLFFERANYYHKNWDNMGNWSTIWKRTMEIIKSENVHNILDIGSGMGQFGQLCQLNNLKYKGIDFSKYAIEYSQKNAHNVTYECVDAYNYHYRDEVDCYTTHEFLEHVEYDTSIISKLKPNKLIIFSVPNFDDPAHVRCFRTIDKVIERYSPYIKDLKVEKVTRVHYLGWGFTI